MVKKVILSVENVSKIYGEGESKTVALNNVSFEVFKEDFLVITGPSGCGKSTLMHIMGLLDSPTKGKVFLNGVDTSKMSEDEKAIFRRRTSGFIFQRFYLLSNFNVFENVSIPLILDEKEKDFIEYKVKKTLSIFGLENRMYYYPNQLSGGQRQRVAIARALVNNPKIIFADEPTGALDSKNGKIVMDILKELNEKGITIVMVTHDPRYFKYGNRIIKMKDGVILEIIE